MPFAVAVAAATPFLVIALLMGLGSDGDQDSPALADASPPATSVDEPTLGERVVEYADGIHEVALAAGQIIEFEMKPGITDIRERAYDDEVLQGFSDRWAADFADLRDGLQEVTPPPGAEESHRLYVAALDGYRQTALLFSEAVQVPDDQREEVLEEAIAEGEATDEVWDEGQDLLAEFLQEHGFEPGRWLPVDADLEG